MAHLVFCCEDARQAFRNRELVWSDAVKGWTLTTIPLRSSSWRARYLASEGRCLVHDGTPYLLDTCRACGGELPFGHSSLSPDADSEAEA